MVTMRRFFFFFAATVLLLAAADASHARRKASNGKTKGSAAEAPAADKDTLEMVEAFLKAETEALPVEHVPAFMAVDPGSLPVRLRDRFLAKREELRALQRVSKAKSKAGLRRLGKKEDEAACDYKEGSGQFVRFRKRAGSSRSPATRRAT